jgi:hypothetical protein
VHFPKNAEKKGDFTYRVKPVFMDEQRKLSYGEQQVASLELSRETYPGQLNVAFTRGFVSSQAFADYYQDNGGIPALIPAAAKEGLSFIPSHPKAKFAYQWMGFEARSEILNALDMAIEDTNSKVKMIAYELNIPELLDRLLLLAGRLMIIIDDSDDHGHHDEPETIAAEQLRSAGAEVLRQKMGGLQHNKMLIIESASLTVAVCGSTNFSWRGVFVQANNALAVYGSDALAPFLQAFDNYWHNSSASGFSITDSTDWKDIPLPGISAKVSFSPHNDLNARLKEIADDIQNTESNLFYSLAFLHQTPGIIREVITEKMLKPDFFMYGISDKVSDGLEIQTPDGSISHVHTAQLTRNLPEPFIAEASGGKGNRMHHKFVVMDFDKPTAKVYLGSYNFSKAADTSNGENLVLIQDQKIAVSYMIEALRLFDHYHFRVARERANQDHKPIQLQIPPSAGQQPWWSPYYSIPKKIKDRELFS